MVTVADQVTGHRKAQDLPLSIHHDALAEGPTAQQALANADRSAFPDKFASSRMVASAKLCVLQSGALVMPQPNQRVRSGRDQRRTGGL